MYVCLCRAITDGQIRQAVQEGVGSVRDLRDQLGVAAQCGKCARCARDIIRQGRRDTVVSR